MRRHPSLIPFSKQHHHILVLAQLLKIDVPDYKGMPQNPLDKLKFCHEQFKQYVLPNMEAHRRVLYPQVKIWGFSMWQLVENIKEKEEQLLVDYKALNSQSPALENALNDLGYLLDEWVRIKERKLYEAVQAQFDEALATLDFK